MSKMKVKNHFWGMPLSLLRYFFWHLAMSGRNTVSRIKTESNSLQCLEYSGCLSLEFSCILSMISLLKTGMIEDAGLFTGFALASLVFSTIAPFVLKMSGETMFNLSLLTTDVWAVAIRIFFYHQQVNWLYYLAFAIVTIGLIIYSMNESSSDDETAASTTETATQYEQLSSEETGGTNLEWLKRKHQEEDTPVRGSM